MNIYIIIINNCVINLFIFIIDVQTIWHSYDHIAVNYKMHTMRTRNSTVVAHITNVIHAFAKQLKL